jgi:fused signal recognition particle receptor
MKMFDKLRFSRLKEGLTKTRGRIIDGIKETISGKALIDDEILEEIEEILISGDVGFDTSHKIIEKTRINLTAQSSRDKETFMELLKEEMISALTSNDESQENNNQDTLKPFVYLIVGVNGSGKTTTIGKLANNFSKSGKKVTVGAADTFRAAANEQLDIWAKRAGVKIIESKTGDDPSSIVFNTLKSAKEDESDIVIIDTAGRLHTKRNLMEELNKINRVFAKVIDYAPNETFLVVDGNTGQNALIQAKEFSKFTNLTGLIVTKLDGTAKGGILFRIADELKIPVRFIGVGEGIDDLQFFDPKNYVEALFS